jgi:hypothetical protein
MADQGTRGGTHEQHVKAGQQSHKNTADSDSKASESHGSHTQGGTHEQHVRAGEQSHKNMGKSAESEGGHTRGGTHEQHVKARSAEPQE